VLTSIWDQRSQDNSASPEYGRLIVPPGTDDKHVIRGDSFETLATGIDERRGERQVEQLFNGVVKEEPGRTNPTMWPISEQGPYYAALVTGGTLDTKGGPRTSPDGQVLNQQDQPIPGLYGVGNCVASASGRAYWAGGATLGPILAFAYRAANAANKEPVKA
jgi:3-oxosteroid 1-dehydrogenase